MRVHDSQAYGKMNETRDRISRVLKLREIQSIIVKTKTVHTLVGLDISAWALETPTSVVDWAQSTN